jgi:serine/threonine protein kinase
MKSRCLPGTQQSAIKIIKSKDADLEAKSEIELMMMMNNPPGCRCTSSHVVRMLDWFEHHGHLCMVFELMGCNLYECLQKHGKPGMPINFVQGVSAQLLDALQFLKEMSVIHGDLKPENIVLENSPLPIHLVSAPQVKIIDFGLAQTVEKVAESFAVGSEIDIQTLPYRAPEVLLGVPITCAADMWSLGCICIELLLGRPLFDHRSTECDIFSLVVNLLGPIPDNMLQAGRCTSRFFSKGVTITRISSSCKKRRQTKIVTPSSRGQDGVRRLLPRPADLRNLICNVWKSCFGISHEFKLKQHESRLQQGHESILSLEKAMRMLRFEVQRSGTCGGLRACAGRRLRPKNILRQVRDRRKALDFVRRTLQSNPTERWEPCVAAEHSFLKDARYDQIATKPTTSKKRRNLTCWL